MAGTEGHAEAVIGVALAEDARQLAGDVRALQRARQVVVGRIIDRLQAQADHRLRLQRAHRPDVDGGADTASRVVGTAGLVHLHRRNRFGGKVGEIERARAIQAATTVAKVGGGHLATVQQHQVVVRADAAHGHLGAFAAGGTVDRHAADALQRFGQVGVREFADVLGDDGIDHAGLATLDVQGFLDAGAVAGDIHRVQVGSGLLLGGRVCRQGQCNAHRQQGNRCLFSMDPRLHAFPLSQRSGIAAV
ncbi:hypothetical protein G6F22_016500 [Rhizopus arrhizus]|nr:hypothetical protein G6F22_016500 [Rhizopus arrhizus]